MLARLKAAAERKGKKLNAEVTTRLDNSLSKDTIGVVKDAFGGKRTFFFMMLLAQVATSIETTTQPVTPSEREKGKWLDDPFIFTKVREGIEEVLRQIEPVGKVTPPNDMLKPPEYVGAADALGTLDGLRLAEGEPSFDEIDADGVAHRVGNKTKRLPLIKAALGPDVISRIGRKK